MLPLILPPHRVRHRESRRPNGVNINQAPDGTTTVTETGFVSECLGCRAPWPCLPAQVATLKAENEQLRRALGRCQMDEPTQPLCDGQCRPDISLYHARCPLHGAPLWGLVLDIEASNSAERAALEEKSAARSPVGDAS